MFVNQYLVVKFLGRGACGKVFLCLNTHDLRLYAMKVRRRLMLGTLSGSMTS
jgi:[calcium/calmodulin-dependent protein kinase] kinase